MSNSFMSKSLINKPWVRYALVTLIPLFILLAMTIQPALTLLYGEEILLETVPYDPRDLFRGDYVTLSYEIERISADKLEEVLTEDEFYDRLVDTYGNNWRSKAYLYVTLQQQGRYHVVDSVSFTQPTDNDSIYLQAQFEYYSQRNDEPELFVSYQLDKYFVPENTGKDLEDASREGALEVKAKVYKGYGLLREVSSRS